MPLPIKKLSQEQLLFILLISALLILIPVNLYAISRNTTALPLSPTPIPAAAQNQSLPITNTPIPSSPPEVTEDPAARLLDKIQQRQPLSEPDITAKNKILATLPEGQTSGTVYESPDIRITYLQEDDLFQIEILTEDIEKAKQESNAWFLTKGFSQKGICNYPIQYFLNFDVKMQLQQKNIQFNPLPPGC